ALDDYLVAGLDVEGRGLTAQTLCDQIEHHPALLEPENVGLEEHAEDLLGVITERAQQNGRRQLTAAVDTRKDRVLGIELEVQPGTAIRDHPRREQQLAGRVGLALVVVEEHARGAVQLRDDDALS